MLTNQIEHVILPVNYKYGGSIYVLTEEDKKKIENLTKNNDSYEKLFNIIEELSSDTKKLDKVRDSLDSYIDRINIAGSYENEKFYKIRIFRCN